MYIALNQKAKNIGVNHLNMYVVILTDRKSVV